MHQYKLLGELAQINTGFTFRKGVKEVRAGNTPIIQAKDIRGAEVSQAVNALPRVELYHVEDKLLKRGDLLVTARNRFEAAVFQSDERCIASSTLVVVRRTSEFVIPEYLAICINSQPGQVHLNQRAMGSTVKSLPLRALHTLQIPVLSLENQQLVINLHATILSQKKLLEQKEALLSLLFDGVSNKIFEGAIK